MPSSAQLRTLVEGLLEQTRIGNILWQPGDKRYSYVFNGSDARVALESKDEDNDYPIRLAIIDRDGRRAHVYSVDAQPAADFEWFYAPIRELWELVSAQDDPVASLIRDISSLPPF